jgi:hypothetical protein
MKFFEYKIGQRWHRKVYSGESVIEILKNDAIYGRVVASTHKYNMESWKNC